MNRRQFLLSSAAIIGTSATPQLAAVLPQIPTEPIVAVSKGRWFAVAECEMYQQYFALDVNHAISQFAEEHDLTWGDRCPECGGYQCEVHISMDQWQNPLHGIECIAPDAWNDLGIDTPPKNKDWAQAGFYTFCDHCSQDFYDDPVDCYVLDDLALCSDCYWEEKRKRGIEE